MTRDVWSVLIRTNPRVLTATGEPSWWKEWHEAGVDPGPDLDRLRPAAVKLAGVTAEEWRALSAAAAALDVTARQGSQGRAEPVLLAGRRRDLTALTEALASAGCEDLGHALKAVLEAAERREFRLRLNGREVDLARRPFLMGVLNVTPDSFSDGGRFFDRQAAIAHGLALSTAGADLIDVGGESTRPGAEPVEAADELNRVLPVVSALAEADAAPVSIDTSKAEVAAECVRAGAALVNDVTALFGDPDMAETLADLEVPVCVMHMQGSPRTMQIDPRYDDLMGEITLFLRRSLAHGTACGIEEEQFLVDPGIGFGKAVSHNLAILNRLPQLRSLGRPIVVGVSRKSYIGKVLASAGRDRPVEGRLLGTAASVALAVARGAQVLRVHEVEEMRDVVRLVHAIQEEEAVSH